MAELTLRQLKKDVAALAKDVARGAEAIHGVTRELDEDAKDTARVAEMIAGMGVDTTSVAEARELAKLTSAAGNELLAYANLGDSTARAAQAAHNQARASHDGINEAYSRAPVDISNMKREWLQQE
ncbi:MULTISPECIES: hypothetical protein [Streptomyces]|uniref:Uncharacterized protein n=1 Tax=Streptomyces mordarskii TaxID=1226758 RepID=A0ABN1DX23_9ACTN